MDINENPDSNDYTITSEDLTYIEARHPYYEFAGSISLWLDSDPDGWKERNLRFETDHPVVIKGDLKTRSYIKTNYRLTVNGLKLAGKF